jgi:hypothetical protein
MKAVIKGDDFETVFAGSIFIQLAPLARKLDRALVGLGAAIGEKYARYKTPAKD